MRAILQLVAGEPAVDHCAVFHAFAEGIARMLRRRRMTARVRTVEG
jgi:hypothetical protein